MNFWAKKAKWNSAFKATPRFYSDEQGRIIGAFALIEGTDTILPIYPQKQFMVESKPVNIWKLVFVSTTEDAIVFEMNYFDIFRKLEKFISDKNDNTILLRPLTYEDMKSVIQSYQ